MRVGHARSRLLFSYRGLNGGHSPSAGGEARKPASRVRTKKVIFSPSHKLQRAASVDPQKSMSTQKSLRAIAPSYGEIWPGQGGVVVDFVPPMGRRPGWYLIAPTGPETENECTTWGGNGRDEIGATDEWDGLANTIAQVQSKANHPAAQWARSIAIDGHHDFYIPSRREMRLLWARVPELFKPIVKPPSARPHSFWPWHLSSTQFTNGLVWSQECRSGAELLAGKNWRAPCRLVRRLSIA